MTETSIGYGYDNRIQWMFFIAKHINNWSPNGDFVQNYFKYLIFEKKIQKTK